MRTALVTGASRGIGRATAIALAARGERVAVHCANNRAAAEETLSLLEGEGHLIIQGDLADPKVAERVVREAEEGLGRLDVLVNNAGIAPGPTTDHPVDEVDFATWQERFTRMLDVDLVAPANLSYLVARSMIVRGEGGVIVNVGSRGAFRGEPTAPAYAAAKAGLHALGQSLALSLAPHGIAVASVAPGFVGTERQQEKLAGEAGDGLRAQSPFGRVGTADEVAAAILYLTSPEAQWASGAILDLNGASHLRT
ncbi:SDR family NAD(P)-dependent oxidoreductase [Brachybacterium aquaticum]|uniref:NAD(P)-dependent dehydrogenase (Short-subunit alcohol dehydrogenase family) n=1 Tax=Brachybacterium aquaticum TaxID=1432564 RepID=A0A841AHF7_9MICO|nr:SDR family NAD(P)-dependent oxidoreductase [Brachybacterium aquaticum]MBB5832478.1 NAD(P)-dependent dehydrogenase (short-subunit alcohol dehydrogenase family) [Brachybacterium aquaticum]